MSETSSGAEYVDLEHQKQRVMLYRARWRRFLLIIQVHRVFISISHHKLNHHHTINTVAFSSTATNALPNGLCGGRHDGADFCINNIYILEDESSLMLPEDQVSIEVHLDDDETDDYCSKARDNANLQRANIVKIVKNKDMGALHSFGGVPGIAYALCTNLELGIDILDDEESLEFQNAGESAQLSTEEQASQAPRPNFFGLIKQYSNNCNILLLFVCAVLSITFGVTEEGLKTGWYEGAIIIGAIFILVLAPSIRDFILQRSKRILDLHKPLERVVVIRGGKRKEVSISNVVVGDVVCLTMGSLIPGDGFFIVNSGDDDQVVVEDGLKSAVDEKAPFLFYGGKVINGNGQMLLVSVGIDTVVGEVRNKVSNTQNEDTSLPAQLDKVGTATQLLGLSISILILVVLFLRFILDRKHSNQHSAGVPDLKNPGPTRGMIGMVNNIVKKPCGKISTFTTSLAILLVGFQEPIPFVIMLAVAYRRKKTFSHMACARELLACVTIGFAKIICAEKLYQPQVCRSYVDDKNIQKGCWDAGVAACIREALCQCISTPILVPSAPGKTTEDPLLPWAASELGVDLEISNQNSTILGIKTLSSGEEGSGVLMGKVDREHGTSDQRSYWKGPATTILAMSSHYYACNGEVMHMDESKRVGFNLIIENMHSDHLKTVAFAFKKIDGALSLEEDDLTFVGIIGLKNTCCSEITDAITACQNAGVKIILASEDDVSTLENCGLVVTNSAGLKGEDFRNLTENERMDLVEKISLMGNSNPSDRLFLVQCLKKKGNVVAAVGSRTTSSATLKEADVGVAIGSWSSVMARESSDIILANGDFSSLTSLIRCGRCNYNNIQKYIQLELTMIISGTLVSFITTVSTLDSPITGIQLILANFMVNLIGGFALMSEPPKDELMRRAPISRAEPLITKSMWRNITTQALYQTSILVAFHFSGKNVLGISKQVSESIVFTSFVVCNVLNMLNSREPEKKNVFKGLDKNPCFYVAVFVILTLQVCFTEISHAVVEYARLSKTHWSLCIVMGFVSVPFDSAAKLTTSFFIKTPPLLPDVGYTSLTPSNPANSSFSINLELPLIIERGNSESIST